MYIRLKPLGSYGNCGMKVMQPLKMDVPPPCLGYSTQSSPSVEMVQTFCSIFHCVFDAMAEREQQLATLCPKH